MFSGCEQLRSLIVSKDTWDTSSANDRDMWQLCGISAPTNYV